ncbi:minichromosome maintenance protein 5 [Orobanche gracilis]
MSGWDEGGIYYSDQAQFPHGGGGSDQAETANRHSVLQRFKEFIRSFQHKSQPNVFPYREALLSNPKYLLVSLADLISYDPHQTLPQLLRQNPADYLPLFETAAAEVLVSLKSRVAGETGEMEEPVPGEVQVLLRSQQDPVSIRLLGAQYISKLVKISGIVIAASRTKAKATYVTLLCKNCKNVKLVPCRPGLGGAIVPRSCDHITQPGEEPCPVDPWIVVPDKSKYVDQQTLKLQENPEDVPTGELPRNVLLSVDRHLVQTIVPGTRLTIMGIYSIFQAANSSTSHKGAVAVRQPYIRVVGLEESNEANSRGPTNLTRDEIDEFKRFASDGNAYTQICSKIAPSIFGHSDVKKAVACLMFGGSRKTLPDGVKLRGDINVLLLGDPSTAKSQFLKFVEKTAPVAVYTSGKGSSAAGLTASVIRDNSSREFYLEGGAMVLADGGVVCIDEFDKMRAEDRVAIHEAMEQQTISIAKAGITTVLNSRTSVLAAANPPSGRYDDLMTAQDNIDLQTTILSRFDLIFIVKDIRTYSQDKNIASHIIKIHASADAASSETRNSKEDNWLKKYIHYCRTECHPRLSESAASRLQESYVKIRQDMRRQANETGEAAVIPITVRQLEAIVRLSEALARMTLFGMEEVQDVGIVDLYYFLLYLAVLVHLLITQFPPLIIRSHVANDNHVLEAIRLFNNATMDAARSGINQHINLTPELANEIKQAETQIKRRMGIGSHISERRLIDELTRMGMNESTVRIRRALLIMHQREEVEYKRERRVIVRKA